MFKHYLLAGCLFLSCLIWMQCQRPAFTSHEVSIEGMGKDTVQLADKISVGDTVTFVYSNRPPLSDTLLYEVSPGGYLIFLEQTEAKMRPEDMFVRMEMSEADRKRQYVFKFKAKKSGVVNFTVISRSNRMPDIEDHKKTWQVTID